MSGSYPRLGLVRFASQDEPRSAMVVEDDKSVELVFHVEHDDDLHRRVLGRSITFGDDPGYSRFDYSAPEVAWFEDDKGALCLVDLQRRHSSLGAVVSARFRYRFAVETDTDRIDYERIHGLRSRLQGLEEWMPIGSIAHERLDPPAPDGSTDRLTLMRRPHVRLSRKLNASVRPSYNFTVSPVPGQSLINDRIDLQTLVTAPRTWNEHLTVHQALRDLLVVSGWQDYSLFDLKAQRSDDPQRVLSGLPVHERWAPVRSREFVEGEKLERSRFLYDFDDVGQAGLNRWVRLREHHHRGIAGMIHGVGVEGAALETLLSEAGAALEHIGFAIAGELGVPPGQRLRSHLRRITSEITADLGFELEHWVLEFADVYNSVKHADRPESDTIRMLNSLRESRLVFRAWVAKRIGVPDTMVERNLRFVPMGRAFKPW